MVVTREATSVGGICIYFEELVRAGAVTVLADTPEEAAEKMEALRELLRGPVSVSAAPHREEGE